jgi:uncharacterized protein YcbK (DUF882 family)
VRQFLSHHFRELEFACHCGCETPREAVKNLQRLCIEALEGVREDFGGPVVVVSGYRCPSHNRAVGGARRSQHLLGTAADIRPLDTDRLEEFVAACERAVDRYPSIGGIGLYRRWVHLDIRPRPAGHVARWTGTGMGSEPTQEA